MELEWWQNRPEVTLITVHDVLEYYLEIISGIIYFVFANIIEAWYDKVNVKSFV